MSVSLRRNAQREDNKAFRFDETHDMHNGWSRVLLGAFFAFGRSETHFFAIDGDAFLTKRAINKMGYQKSRAYQRVFLPFWGL